MPAGRSATIQVDLSRLREVGDVIRVGDLTVGAGVTILIDHNEMVAGLQQRTLVEKAEGAEGKPEAVAAAPETPARGGTER